MPKIHLKPKSPEFAEDTQEQVSTRICDVPGCEAAGVYPAPTSRDLQRYNWYCLPHIQDINKGWNYFEGMSDIEIEDYIIRSHLWDRPTWKFSSGSPEEEILKKTWQFYHFTEEEPPGGKDQKHDRDNRRQRHMPYESQETEALSIMGLEPPITLADIKTRYKKLAKQHHPDHNPGDKESEEYLKKINMAYAILKVAYARFEKLETGE